MHSLLSLFLSVHVIWLAVLSSFWLLSVQVLFNINETRTLVNGSSPRNCCMTLDSQACFSEPKPSRGLMAKMKWGSVMWIPGQGHMAMVQGFLLFQSLVCILWGQENESNQISEPQTKGASQEPGLATMWRLQKQPWEKNNRWVWTHCPHWQRVQHPIKYPCSWVGTDRQTHFISSDSGTKQTCPGLGRRDQEGDKRAWLIHHHRVHTVDQSCPHKPLAVTYEFWIGDAGHIKGSNWATTCGAARIDSP